MDGHGMRGGANMSAPQAYVSTRPTAASGADAAVQPERWPAAMGRTAEGRRATAAPVSEPPANEAPPWDAAARWAGGQGEDHLTVLKRAAEQVPTIRRATIRSNISPT